MFVKEDYVRQLQEVGVEEAHAKAYGDVLEDALAKAALRRAGGSDSPEPRACRRMEKDITELRRIVDRLAWRLEHRFDLEEMRADSRLDRLKHEFQMQNMDLGELRRLGGNRR